ncbi:hypothetical protein [Pleionea litopenaei]|uniref:Uncharacterized protein n=1 Tax=Pleionea litopenaei TaxID=3070815 RepID=A0AA51RWJ9_9GAMM|nr:hypothetical protein [Pleionea sp. HL-JVS1]WMS88819.1 hypothetical protein Q9312_07845 [Pleionea sp. HL-JVS1]
MPAYLCKCGSRVSVGRIPCEHQWNFISDVDYDRYSGKFDAEELFKEMKEFFKCPECSRLAFFWQGWDAEPVFYTEESK